jgi:hypothetical protein
MLLRYRQIVGVSPRFRRANPASVGPPPSLRCARLSLTPTVSEPALESAPAGAASIVASIGTSAGLTFVVDDGVVRTDLPGVSCHGTGTDNGLE